MPISKLTINFKNLILTCFYALSEDLEEPDAVYLEQIFHAGKDISKIVSETCWFEIEAVLAQALRKNLTKNKED
jgi:hypothetical protein